MKATQDYNPLSITMNSAVLLKELNLIRYYLDGKIEQNALTSLVTTHSLKTYKAKILYDMEEIDKQMMKLTRHMNTLQSLLYELQIEEKPCVKVNLEELETVHTGAV